LERYKEKKSRYKNYLEDVRPKRSYSIDYNRIDDMDLEDAQYKLSKLEKNAQRK
jgi:hypothetical protein